MKLDGHTSLTGANGAGKTSLLRLIPLFYGESPNKLVQGGGVNQSFVQYYLPHTTSYIVFEYSRRGKICMVVMHASRSGESVYYRFIDQPFSLERFRDESGELINGADLLRHIRKRGEFCTEQISSLSDYRAIIQHSASGNKDHRKLASSYAFVGAGSRLSHVEKIVTGMFSRMTNFRDIKRMIVSCIVDDKNSIRLESSKTAMKEWGREYRSYTSVMSQAERMKEFQESLICHDEAVRQIKSVHADFVRLQQVHEAAIAHAAENAKTIREDMQSLEENTNSRLREISSRLGSAEGRVKDLENAITALDEQHVDFEKNDLNGLARLVDALPRMVADLQAMEKRENTLLGASKDLSNQYSELRNQRTETFHALEREQNELKEPIRIRVRNEENQARLDANSAWQSIASEFEKREEFIDKAKESLLEKIGILKREVAHPLPAQHVVEGMEKTRSELEAARESAAAASKELEEAKLRHSSEKNSFDSIDAQIREFREKERNDLARRDRLYSLRDADPGTLLHFLREFRPEWTRDIARVVPEELLLRTDLSPSLVGEDALSLYGIGLDLAVLDVPRAADEDALQYRIAEIERAIEHHRQNVKELELDLEKSSGLVSQAKEALEDKQRNRVRADNKVKSCQAAFDAAERALKEETRQASHQARQKLQDAEHDLNKLRKDQSELKSERNAKKQQHEAGLKGRISAIQSRADEEIAKIDLVILDAKSSWEHDIDTLNRELDSALKAKGIDTVSLEKLRNEKNLTQDKIRRARSNEVRVGDWRRWLSAEWASRPSKVEELEKSKTSVIELQDQKSKEEQDHNTRHDELNRKLNRIEQNRKEIEKLLGFVIRRREHLSRWPAEPVGKMEKPGREQDALEADMDRLLQDIRNEEARAREVLVPMKRVFFENPGTTPFQFYEKKRLALGPDQENASPFLWYPPLKEWFEAEHESARRLLMSQCRNFASGIHEFHGRLSEFKRLVGVFSRDLQENMTASTRFRSISSIAVRITTSFDTLEGWDKIRQLVDEYDIWSGKEGNDLPDASFADAVDQVSDWLQGRHTMEVKLEDLLELEIDIEEVGQPRKTVKDEGQLRDASSNGLSYLILCVVFVGLINKIRAGQPVQMVWALDELRDLDLDNVQALLEMLDDNGIHLVSAFPDPEPEILALLKNCYAIQEGRRLATFRREVSNV